MKQLKFYILCFFMFSVLGWLWEVFYNYIRTGIFINSGTLVGPWLPIYGWAGILITFISKKIKNNPILLYLISFILFGIIEYLTSVYLEIVHHMRWWDYSKYVLNINGRIWIIGLLVYALFSILIVYCLVPLIEKMYKKINKKVLGYILVILLLLHTTDYIYSTLNPERGNAKKINCNCTK